jgi:hypothetical protein
MVRFQVRSRFGHHKQPELHTTRLLLGRRHFQN